MKVMMSGVNRGNGEGGRGFENAVYLHLAADEDRVGCKEQSIVDDEKS